MSKLAFTMNQLMANDPCEDGLDRLTKSLGTYTGPTIVNLVDHSDHLILSDILWCFKLTNLNELERRTICTKVAIFAARSVLHIFENEYPDDQRPRRAIEAAEECVECNFSAESVERAGPAGDNAWAARAAAARAAAAWAAAAWAAAVVSASAAPAAVVATATAARAAAEASDNPDALRAEIKNYLLELLRTYE